MEEFCVRHREKNSSRNWSTIWCVCCDAICKVLPLNFYYLKSHPHGMQENAFRRKTQHPNARVFKATKQPSERTNSDGCFVASKDITVVFPYRCEKCRYFSPWCFQSWKKRLFFYTLVLVPACRGDEGGRWGRSIMPMWRNHGTTPNPIHVHVGGKRRIMWVFSLVIILYLCWTVK